MTGDDLDPYIGRAIMADGIGTGGLHAVGGAPTTTYAENIGVMAATRVYSTAAYYVAGVIAILFGLCPKFGALVASTPGGVLGGVTVVLYGMIGLLGAKIWIENRVDFANPINLVPDRRGHHPRRSARSAGDHRRLHPHRHRAGHDRRARRLPRAAGAGPGPPEGVTRHRQRGPRHRARHRERRRTRVAPALSGTAIRRSSGGRARRHFHVVSHDRLNRVGRPERILPFGGNHDVPHLEDLLPEPSIAPVPGVTARNRRRLPRQVHARAVDLKAPDRCSRARWGRRSGRSRTTRFARSRGARPDCPPASSPISSGLKYAGKPH